MARRLTRSWVTCSALCQDHQRKGNVLGILVLQADDLLMAGSAHFGRMVVDKLKMNFQIGYEDTNDVTFTGQRVRWHSKAIVVDQDKAV